MRVVKIAADKIGGKQKFRHARRRQADIAALNVGFLHFGAGELSVSRDDAEILRSAQRQGTKLQRNFRVDLRLCLDCGLLRREPDLFRPGRSRYRICEPLITFYHAVTRPHWGQLEASQARAVWLDARPRFLSRVAGPHFEQLCRHWARYFAPEQVIGGFPSQVEPGTVNDPVAKKTHQVDVAAIGYDAADRLALQALGEVKWHETMGMAHLERRLLCWRSNGR